MAETNVAVPKEVREMFATELIQGEGGFQSLCRRIAKRLETGGVIRFQPDEFKQLVRYSAHYGQGGYQQRLRTLLALWVSQHLNEVIE